MLRLAALFTKKGLASTTQLPLLLPLLRQTEGTYTAERIPFGLIALVLAVPLPARLSLAATGAPVSALCTSDAHADRRARPGTRGAELANEATGQKRN